MTLPCEDKNSPNVGKTGGEERSAASSHASSSSSTSSAMPAQRRPRIDSGRAQADSVRAMTTGQGVGEGVAGEGATTRYRRACASGIANAKPFCGGPRNTLKRSNTNRNSSRWTQLFLTTCRHRVPKWWCFKRYIGRRRELFLSSEKR